MILLLPPLSDETHLPPDSTILSQPSPSVPPDAALSSLSSPSSYGTSARDIMARTRAKLARLRGEVPGGSIVAGGDLGTADVVDESGGMGSGEGGGGGGSASASVKLRARLVERLEEEKRRAMGQSLTGAGLQREAAESPTTPLGDSTSSKDNPDASGILLPQQAEMKLRAQALMRVRLAAEKRRADGAAAEGIGGADADAVPRVREEALRARLLSRRGVV